MGWLEKLENIQFKITTGDGKSFTPLWRNSEKSKEFNISKYDFINVEGSFIDRKQPQSNLYPLTFYFQGEDNIEQCNAFEASADDKRLWTIEHPFYGIIKGQPTNLKRNDAAFNVTEVTVEFWESIDGDFPESEVSIEDEVRAKVTSVNELSASFLAENSTPDTGDINLIKDNVILSGSKFSPDTDSFNDFQNSIDKAFNNSDNLVTDTKASFLDVQNVINLPAEFNTSVLSKINSYIDAYNVIKESIDNLFSKYNFESQGASILAGMCLSCTNPLDGDYVTRNDIETVNNLLVNLYEDYLETLDNNQVEIYDIENTWSPTVQIQSDLLDLVFFTSNSLFLLSFNARQERTVELTEDSNLIILTHKYMGLDSEDKNIETFKEINNIKNNELFKVRKGRTIKYFV
jgi:hypothetical protein